MLPTGVLLHRFQAFRAGYMMDGVAARVLNDDIAHLATRGGTRLKVHITAYREGLAEKPCPEIQRVRRQLHKELPPATESRAPKSTSSAHTRL